AYYTSSSAQEASIKAAAFVDSRLYQLGITLSSRIPPRDMQPRLLRAYLEGGSPDQAQRLIRDVLEHDRMMDDAQSQHAEMEVDFVLGIVEAKDMGSLQEVWTRAKAGWIGYPKRSLCGSRTILNAVVEQLDTAGPHSRKPRLAEPIAEHNPEDTPTQPFTTGDFAQNVVTTFAEIHLRWPMQSNPKDLKAYNNACQAFGYPEKVIRSARPSKAPSAEARQTNPTASPKASSTLTKSDLPDITQLSRSMHPSNPLEERKSAAKRFISSIREGPAVTRTGSTADLRLRRFAAAVALDACWPPDVWDALLGDSPRTPWSRDLRATISQAAFARWKKDELDEEYCLKTLRRLRSRWAKEIQRDRHTRRLLMAQVRRRARTQLAHADM
ncbi:hypothetical protein FRC01_014007, partial [Tulasnella sp. 417]